MSDRLVALAICNAASVAATVGAGVVAYSGHNGWGWLIVAALVLHCTPGDPTSKESADG